MRPTILALVAVSLLASFRPTGAADDRDAQRTTDEALLKTGGVKLDAAGLLAFFRKRTPQPKDLRRMEALVRQLGSEEFEEREQASKELKECGEPALPLLRKGARDADVELALRARDCLSAIEGSGQELGMAASRALARLAPPEAGAVLLAYLPYARDGIGEEAVCATLALLVTRSRTVDPALTAALTDKTPLRRGAAAFALGRRAEEPTRTAVRRLLLDPDRQVRMQAALGLLAGRDRTAIPALIDLASGPPNDLTWQAEAQLLNVAGESAPTKLPNDDELLGRARRRAAWLAWLQGPGEKVELTNVDEAPRLRNVTLVPEMHANKVWECGPDGKPRWEVAVSGCPIDAQVLPGNRLLVAELNAHQVTERDSKGTILWKFAIDTPIACQRLSNGHTWVATNHKWLVVDREGKEITSYTPMDKDFFIHSIQRQPNGHVVMISMEGVIREVTGRGNLVRDVELPTHGGWSGIETVPGGRYLATNFSEGRVYEIDAAGKVVWEYRTGGACYAQRLPNGHTLVVSNSSGLIEIDKDKNEVWKQPISSALWRAHRR